MENKNKKNTNKHDHCHDEHDHEHMSSRRNFLKNSVAGMGMGMMLSQFPLYSFNRLFSEDEIAGKEDRILIQLTLNGGCDGLNTIIPLNDYSNYKRLRPTIGYNQSELISLSDEYAMPSVMQPLKKLWDEGKMKVVHGTGYEDQNLSHFRSADIWHTASDSDEYLKSGWMARYMMETDPDIIENPPSHPSAVQVGGQGSLLFNNFNGNSLALQASRIETLFRYADKGSVYSLEGMPECEYGDNMEYLRLITNSTFKYADVIKEAYDNGKNNVTYNNPLGDALGLIARVISGGLKTKIYHVYLSGFDTHANQKQALPNLLQSISDAVSQFYVDTEIEGTDKEILIMTQSEFGRRPYENGSSGTDHGSAAPLFLFGPGLNGNGFISQQPSLTDFDQADNLKYNTDFRRVYSSVLQDWFCLPESSTETVLGGSYDTLDLGFDCVGSTAITPSAMQGLSHRMIQTMDGKATLILNLEKQRSCHYSIYDVAGRRVSYQDLGLLSRGEHRIELNKGSAPNGYYFMTFHAGAAKFSEKVLLIGD